MRSRPLRNVIREQNILTLEAKASVRVSAPGLDPDAAAVAFP